jgi:hypothetical protein
LSQAVAAQFEIESEICKQFITFHYFSFKRLVPSTVSVVLIGPTCTASPGDPLELGGSGCSVRYGNNAVRVVVLVRLRRSLFR